jgi:hypothetical protein
MQEIAAHIAIAIACITFISCLVYAGYVINRD